MTLSLFDVCFPVLARGLGNLSAILDVGEAHAAENDIPPATLLGARLVADMLPLTAQVQFCSDTARRAAMRLGGVPMVRMEDTEATFVQLHARIAATQDVIRQVDPDTVNGNAGTMFDLPIGGGRTRPYSGQDYVLEFVLPNFFFHAATAYGLLRHNGVSVGKRHFVGWA